jgi:hypothetical protein
MVSMMAGNEAREAELASAKQLHDELLPEMPAGAHDSSACLFCTPRETAAEGAPVAGENEGSKIDPTDPVINAIVNERVTRETAALTLRAETAEGKLTEVQTQLDVVSAEKVAAEQARDEAATKLTDYETAAAELAASGERKEGRLAALKEVAAGMPDAFLTDERVDRICKQSDAEFETYKGEMAAAFAGVKPAAPTTDPKAGKDGKDGPPRETAMSTAGGGGSDAAADTRPASSQWIGSTSAFSGRR